MLFKVPFSKAADFEPNAHFTVRTVHRSSFNLRDCSPCLSHSLRRRTVRSNKSLSLPFNGARHILDSVTACAGRMLSGNGGFLVINNRRLIDLPAVRTTCRGCPSLRIVRVSTRASLHRSCVNRPLSRTSIVHHYFSFLKSNHVFRFNVHSNLGRRFR